MQALLQNKRDFCSGNFYSNKCKILTHRQTIKLFQEKERLETEGQKKKAKVIKDYLWCKNRRWVFKIVYKMMNTSLRGLVGSLDFEDLVQEGLLGLIKAIDYFDWKKGYRFSTYSYWWIRQSISRGIDNNSQTIRISSQMRDRIMKFNKTKEKMMVLGYLPSDKKVAEIIGLNPAQFQELQKAIEGISGKNLRSFDVDFYSPSDNKNQHGRDTERLLDYVLGEQEMFPVEKEVEEGELKESIRDLILLVLSEKERIVILKRYGFDNDNRYTLQALGNEFGCTRERVRQIQNLALKKLKKVFLEDLKDYIQNGR